MNGFLFTADRMFLKFLFWSAVVLFLFPCFFILSNSSLMKNAWNHWFYWILMQQFNFPKNRIIKILCHAKNVFRFYTLKKCKFTFAFTSPIWKSICHLSPCYNSFANLFESPSANFIPESHIYLLGVKYFTPKQCNRPRTAHFCYIKS